MRIDAAAGRCLVITVAMFGLLRSSFAQQVPPFDADGWYEQLYASRQVPDEDGRLKLGLYPGVGAALGAPDVISGQASLFLSVTAGSSFSLYVGYGEEWGTPADSQIFTLGWGGVRDVRVVTRQRGFYGKFLRYRRWDVSKHGLHHGLSAGIESGVGHFSLAFEFGAARSSQDHWIVVAQVALKLALPISIPVGR